MTIIAEGHEGQEMLLQTSLENSILHRLTHISIYYTLSEGFLRLLKSSLEAFVRVQNMSPAMYHMRAPLGLTTNAIFSCQHGLTDFLFLQECGHHLGDGIKNKCEKKEISSG